MSKLKKNIIFSITYQILILVVPLVTSSYLARTIGADGIGRYSYAYSIALYFTYFTILGLNKYGNRMIASVQNNAKLRSKNFFEIYALQIVCFVLCFLAYMIYVFFFAKDKSMALIQIIFVCSSLFDINWFFWGMEMFDKTVVRNTFIKLGTMILLFGIVKSIKDDEKYALIMACSYLISQLALWPYLCKYVKPCKISLDGVKKHVLPNFSMFFPVIAVSVYKIMDKVMLGAMSNTTNVGLYENAEKIISVPVAVVTALGSVMLPRVTALISEKKDQEVHIFRDVAILGVTAFTVAACFGIHAVSEQLAVWMWGNEFLMSGIVMKYLAITLLFLGIGNVIRTQFLIPYGYDRIYVVSAVVGAIINVVINILLIPKWGPVGAAIGTVFAEVAVCVYQLVMIRKYLPMIKYIKDTIFFCGAGLVMCFVIKQLPTMKSIFGNLVISGMVGCLIYILLVGPYVYKNLRKYIQNRI